MRGAHNFDGDGVTSAVPQAIVPSSGQDDTILPEIY
jgi:hypothetical protein